MGAGGCSDFGNETTHLTEARILRKEGLKANRGAGIKPKRRQFVIGEVSDDCGDGPPGLGKDVQAFTADKEVDNTEPSDDERKFAVNMPSPTASRSNAFSTAKS